VTDEATKQTTDALYRQLTAAGVEVLLDDRDVRAGVKFKDADLTGIPLRVVISERGIKEGKLEIKWRWDKQAEFVAIAGAAEALAALIQTERQDGARFHNWRHGAGR
jgi:prolyl-tRNA synthetase